MSKTYKGSLSLEWYNKQHAIMLKKADDIGLNADIPAPKINWVNRDEALFYEIDSEEGIGQTPYWVNSNDIRVKESRPFILQKVFKATTKNKPGTIPGMDTILEIEESKTEDLAIENFLIKGDNLLALNTLKKYFSNKHDSERVKCIYIDPPYNTGAAFENYDDGLAESEWLTLMRDRLVVLRELLQESGSIFISIDNNESSYLQVLMDGIFGRNNRKNIITIKRGSVTGAKVINPGLVNISEFILVYAKNSEFWENNRILRAKERDERYSSFIENYEDDFRNWKYCSLLDGFAHSLGIPKKELKNKFTNGYEKELDQFVYKNANRVIQFATLDENSVSKEAKRIKEVSKNDEHQTYKLDREGKNPYFIYKGKLLLFAKDRLLEIDGELTFSEPATDIWDDVLPNDLHNEGGVEFRKGKKPEKLIQRIIEMSTKPGDIVLDCFVGSGSTCAVAHKTKRKWIGIEIGNHADTHCVPRLKSVISGTDQSGISKLVSWKGGGAFKYYHLGKSIITLNKDGSGDFNWNLGKKFIEESFLSSYDYLIDRNINLSEGSLFPDETNKPSIGIQTTGTKKRVAVITLNEPKGKRDQLSYDEIFHIYSVIKKKLNPEYINIFTNKGLELAFDSKPDDLEVFKIPHAIFSELEK